MTTRPSARRLLARTAPPVGAGGLALVTASYVGAPAWVLAVSAAAGAFIGVLPQESEHRRDVWRDWLRHRERMARLRITAAQAQPRASGVRGPREERAVPPTTPG
ncbi:hypothetical protein [Streptomyces olivochromogenes]|uniref:hypothetical protein n=1 Tax=Streptomyces olivochromogenes TaxID=1963 RepID=UPI001F1BE6B3|nr:hypothetical protein [Streptomyces olivochromogenes]MCF3132433.1 hypothetical protein [Streptomyces olivochromogenes]